MTLLSLFELLPAYHPTRGSQSLSPNPSLSLLEHFFSIGIEKIDRKEKKISSNRSKYNNGRYNSIISKIKKR